jgi:hypothetical protein
MSAGALPRQGGGAKGAPPQGPKSTISQQGEGAGHSPTVTRCQRRRQRRRRGGTATKATGGETTTPSSSEIELEKPPASQGGGSTAPEGSCDEGLGEDELNDMYTGEEPGRTCKDGKYTPNWSEEQRREFIERWGPDEAAALCDACCSPANETMSKMHHVLRDRTQIRHPQTTHVESV